MTSIEPRYRHSTNALWFSRLLHSPHLAYFAVLVLLAVSGWFAWRTLHPSTVEQLLAQAYTENRTMVMRIPGAKYSPPRISRSLNESSFDKPRSLLKAEYLIAENLSNNPKDPSWLEARARADLLEGHYQTAIKTLQRALEFRPGSTALLIDLGSAYFLRAESVDDPIDYARSVHSLGEALAKSPNDSVALFNDALACEQTFFYARAVQDWQQYLRLDPRSQWSDEARQHLLVVQQKMRPKQHSEAQPLAAPSVVAHPNARQESEIDARIEDYLTVALSEWLPQAYSTTDTSGVETAEARSALNTLSKIAVQKHGDLWLTDLLSGASSREFGRAIGDLCAAIRANERADTSAARFYSREAAMLFNRGNDQAGVVRSQFEFLVALNTDQDGTECGRSAPIFVQGVRRPYHVLSAQIDLEVGSCAWLRDDLGTAKQEYIASGVEALKGNFKSTYLRSLDHLSGLQAASGDLKSAWRTAWRGLSAYWSGIYPDVRGYNFYYNFYEASRLASLPRAQMAAWQDGVRLSDSSQDLAQRGMAHVLMANVAEGNSMPQLAEREFDLATKLFAVAPQTKSTQAARLEAEARMAGVETRSGNPQAAISRLKPLQNDLDMLSDSYLAMLFYTNLAQAETSLGDLNQADGDLRRTVDLAERQLRTIHDETTRREIVTQSALAYRALVEGQLVKGDIEGALGLWEWYRGSPIRAGRPDSHISLVSSATLPGRITLAREIPLLTDETILTYAFLPRGLAVWVVDDRGVFSHWIAGKTDKLIAMANRFRALCSDPESDRSELIKQGRMLYDLLLSPVQQHLSIGRTLVIELDDELEGLPFEALVDKSGRYLGDRPLIASLGLYYTSTTHPFTPITADARAFIAAVETSRAADVPPLPDVLTEGDRVAEAFPDRILLKGVEATRTAVLSHLPGATVFHFAGHAAKTSRNAGLLLSDTVLVPSDLRGVSLSKLQLAVLSACDTQDGPDGGFTDANSMVRALLGAGALTVVASRWNVDSLTTSHFMELFYKLLLSGNSVAASLRQAQQTLRSEPHTDRPYYWAAFGTYGVS